MLPTPPPLPPEALPLLLPFPLAPAPPAIQIVVGRREGHIWIARNDVKSELLVRLDLSDTC
jgi:hypothetical protein